MIYRLLLVFAFLAFLAPVSASAEPSRTATLEVSKMDCAACPITVRKALEKVPGVQSAKVDFKAKRATVSFDAAQTSPEALTKATTAAGFPSAVIRTE